MTVTGYSFVFAFGIRNNGAKLRRLFDKMLISAFDAVNIKDFPSRRGRQPAITIAAPARSRARLPGAGQVRAA